MQCVIFNVTALTLHVRPCHGYPPVAFRDFVIFIPLILPFNLVSLLEFYPSFEFVYLFPPPPRYFCCAYTAAFSSAIGPARTLAVSNEQTCIATTTFPRSSYSSLR